MAAKLTRLTHKIAIQLHLVAESSLWSSRCKRPIRKLLDTSSYVCKNSGLNPVSLKFKALKHSTAI